MATFRRLLAFLRPYRTLWIASFSLALLAMLGTVAAPALIGRAIDRIQAGDRGGLWTVGGVLVVVGVLRALLTVGRRLVAGRVSLGVELDLRRRLYGHLQELELGFFDTQQTGQLMSRATVDLSAVRFFLGYGLVFVVQSLLTIVLAAGAMIAVQPSLAWLALLPAPIVVWVGNAYGRAGRPAQQAAQQAIAEVTASAEESVAGIRVVKAFAAEDRRRVAFGAAVDEAFAKRMVAVRLQARFQPAMSFLPQIGLAIVLALGGRQVIDGTLSTGEFLAFYAYVLMLLGPLRSLGVMLGLAQRATASGARLFEILDRAPRIVAPPAATPLPEGGGALRLERVTLAYAGQRVPALVDVDLEVAAGERLAIVGETGSGKTSLLQLLPRLYDPTEGRVLIDGADVRDLDPIELRRRIAIVDDDPFLFSATIAENVAYARPEASHEEVVDAVRRARLLDVIEALPDGYATRVGERGLTLSGGQRQRLAIARAILARPRILALDDATSNVDAATEREILDALEEVMEGRTTLVVAHRLSTVRLADRVVVLQGGRVAELGHHEELLERSELYREIVVRGLPGQVFLGDCSAREIQADEEGEVVAAGPAGDSSLRGEA